MAKGIANGFPMGAVVTTPGTSCVSVDVCAYVYLCVSMFRVVIMDHVVYSCRDCSNNDTSPSHEHLRGEPNLFRCCISCA